MRTAEQIVEAYHLRRRESETMFGRMRAVRDVYNGDLVIPIDDEDQSPAVANLILTGIDQMAGRIASVMPQVWFPPTRPGIKSSEERASDRNAAIKAIWEENGLAGKLRRRSRYLVAYSQAPVYLRPDAGQQLPTWEVRNPLQVYPARDLADPMVPTDCITAFNKPVAWLKHHHPEYAAYVLQPDTEDTQQITLLEYVDADQISLVYAGVLPHWEPGEFTTQLDSQELPGVAIFMPNGVTPNLAGCPLVTVPERPVLDRPQGQFDQMIGMFETQARLTALEVVQVERGIFPDTYLVSRPGEVARFIHGPFDGRSGEVNIVAGGDVKELSTNPGFSTNPMIDRLERSQRLQGGVPPEFGGESTTNIRTGRRGDAVLSAVIDYPILEAQETFADALRAENTMAMKIAMAFWGDTKVSHYYRMRKSLAAIDYVPNLIFAESTRHSVTYPVAGADMNALVVGMGQRIGLGIMSKRTAAEMDPMVDDAEFEMDRVVAEGLEAAVVASIQNQAAAGAIPPEVVARTANLVKTDRYDVAEALAVAIAEYAAAQQAEAAAAAPSPVQDIAAADATTSALPPPGPEAAPTVPESGQGLQNLSGLLTALRKTNTRDAGRAALGGNY